MTNKQFKAKRSKILREIFMLEVDYSEKTDLERKIIDRKIRNLGIELEKISNPKKSNIIESILDKGSEVTTSDVITLLNYEVSIKDIINHTKISEFQLRSFRRNVQKNELRLAR